MLCGENVTVKQLVYLLTMLSKKSPTSKVGDELRPL